jgi:hypothetical protein
MEKKIIDDYDDDSIAMSENMQGLVGTLMPIAFSLNPP